MWETKTIIFSLPKNLWLPNLAGRWITLSSPTQNVKQHVTWPYDHVVLHIAWQTNMIICAIPKCLWLPTLVKWRYAMSSFLLSSSFHHRGLETSRQKLNLLYLYYHNAYVHRTWQVVTYSDKLPSIKSHNTFNTWSRDSLKTCLLYYNTYGHISW